VDRTKEKSEVLQALAAREDLLRMGLPRVNLLFTGADGAIRNVLETLLGNLQQPIASWSPGQPLVLPPADRTGTIVLHDVGALGIQDQIRLLEWLGISMGRTQVVSTSAFPLLPRVEAGTFIDNLYYRLNMVYMDMAGLES
jgi:transcriptional regulator of acetoin/glycerol metabolism